MRWWKRKAATHISDYNKWKLTVQREPVPWTLADAEFMRHVFASPAWAKLCAMSRDSMLEDLCPSAPGSQLHEDLAFIRAFVSGRRAQMEFLEHWQAPAKTKQDAASRELAEDEEGTPIQFAKD